MIERLIARQGDVGFVTGKIPTSAKKIPLRPFALGEVTGHSHAVIEADKELCEMYEDENGTIWVRALAEVHIKHEDHDPTGTISILPAGFEGRFPIAKEYDEEGDFQVLD